MKTELLKALCELPGASGFEEKVREFLIKAWSLHVDDYWVDGMENLIAVIKSKKDEEAKLNILIVAHMDEVGLIVRDITSQGFIHFDALGGQIDAALSGQLWNIHTEKGTVIGYTGLESGHTMASFPPSEVVHQHHFFIDVGASSREEVEALGIRTGSSITYGGPSFVPLPLQNRVLARALDDRFALSAMTELVEEMAQHKEDLPFNLYVAATVQEELGMRGSKVLFKSLGVKPDLVINLDIGLARDYPLLYSQASPKPPTTTIPELGKGMTITTHDSGMVTNPKLVDFLIRFCREGNLKHQLDSVHLGSTDGCSLQQSGKGLSVVNVGIPIRYAHSHLGVMDPQDYDTLLAFLKLFCHQYDLEVHEKLFPQAKTSQKGIFGKTPLPLPDEQQDGLEKRRELGL